MSYSFFTGAMLLHFLGIRTLINIMRDEVTLKSYSKYTAVIIIVTIVVASVNYVAAQGYKNLAVFAAVPFLSVAAAAALSAAFKLKQRASAVYLSLLPAGVAFLSYQYSQNYGDMLFYSLKSSLEFFITAILIFKIYKKVNLLLPEPVKGAPAILIIAALLSIVLTGLI